MLNNTNSKNRDFNEVIDIKKFKNELKTGKYFGLALDIDETLSFTLMHWFSELQKRFGNPENLTVSEIIKKYRYAKDVPYWQTPEAHSWMNEARFSNDLQAELPLIENSNYLVQKLHKHIPILAYLTVRPQSVTEGTVRWLKKHNFPAAAVIGRPQSTPHEDGSKWKAEVLNFLYPEIKGIVDDQPALVEALPKTYKGTIYLYNSSQSPKSNLSIFPCPTWEDVLKFVRV